ncbi:MAG TPA: 3-hydroxybutyryl-CoA dehydrogenase [Cyclobacteriaceae bacterium]
MKKVTVVGSGTMGNGIAHAFAQSNYEVVLYDINKPSLEKAMITIDKNLDRQVKKDKISVEDKKEILSRIITSKDLKKSVDGTALVVEAATENEEIKFQLFSELDRFCGPDTILSTNTSSISITKIASKTDRPDKVIGMHFMNPVPVMQLVEVIRGYATSDETTNLTFEISKSLGKVPVEVNDYPGFVANRILMPMINEAISALHEGVAGVNEIDTVMRLGMAHPMGPLHLADFIGLDVCLSILTVMFDGFKNPKYAPCPLLVNMVQAGYLGVKSKEGFYSYHHGTKDLIVSSRFKK